MTIEEYRAEVQAAGLSDITTDRLDRWINRARKKVAARYPWPFLNDTETAAAPLTITDLGIVQSVTDSNGVVLPFAEYTALDRSYDLTTASGLPSYWYFDGTVIKTYPVATGSITVRYVKSLTDLAAATEDTIPDAHAEAVIADVMRRGWLEAGEIELSREWTSEYNDAIETMRRDLFGGQVQDNRVAQISSEQLA